VLVASENLIARELAARAQGALEAAVAAANARCCPSWSSGKSRSIWLWAGL